MKTDLDTLATALYVKTDDLLMDHPGWAPARPVVGIAPKLADAQLVMLAVMQALLGFTSEARWLRHARAHLRSSSFWTKPGDGLPTQLRVDDDGDPRLLACADVLGDVGLDGRVDQPIGGRAERPAQASPAASGGCSVGRYLRLGRCLARVSRAGVSRGCLAQAIPGRWRRHEPGTRSADRAGRGDWAAHGGVPASSCAGATPGYAGAAAPGHVVVVDWDGFDPSYLHRTRLPSLEALRRRGVRAHAWATYRPASNPSRASLVTGAYPQTHRNSAYVYDPAANVITGQTRRLAVDNLARSITRQGGTVAAAGWYMVENNGAYLGNPGALYVGAHGCEGNTDNAVRILRGEPVQSAGKQITVPRVPDLLAVYCPELDTVGHRVGPRSARITEVLRRLDAQLGRIVYATRQVGIHDDTTFVLVSDHGMTEFSQTAHDVLLHRLTAEGFRAEILVRGESPRPETEVIVAENERAAGVHLRGRAATPAARKRLRHLFAEISQIARVRDQRALRALHTAPSEGDFVLEARRPWCFVAPRKMPPPGTEKGAHGTLEEMTVPLVFAGRGIRAGSSPVQPRTIDVAPTLSALLGLQPPAHAQGRVLREILTSQATPVASMAGPAP